MQRFIVIAVCCQLLPLFGGCSKEPARRTAERRNLNHNGQASVARRAVPKRRSSPAEKLLFSPTMIQRLPVALGAKVKGTPVLLSVTRKGIIRQKQVLAKIVGGRVPASAKRGNPDGFFITDLHKHFSQLTKQRKAAGNKKPGCVLLAVDRGLSYRVVAAVLYTVNQTGFNCFAIAVNPPPAKKSGVRMLPLSTATSVKLAAGKKRSGLLRRTDDWGQVYWERNNEMNTLDDIEIK